MVKIELENGGVITLELLPQIAPKTCENFINLVNAGFYNGKIFHRVIPGFMIQGGCPYGNGTGGTQPIYGEFDENGWQNIISHKRGVISMARTNDPNSGSCQFFICHGNATFLDGKYASFGYVISGIEYVDAIANTPRDANDKPFTDQIIKEITII